MNVPLDEPEFSRWRYVPEDSEAALRAAERVLELVDATWESIA